MVKSYSKIKLCEETNLGQFGLAVKRMIGEIQEQGLEVDVKYSTCLTKDNRVLYSAMILGYTNKLLY